MKIKVKHQCCLILVVLFIPLLTCSLSFASYQDTLMCDFDNVPGAWTLEDLNSQYNWNATVTDVDVVVADGAGSDGQYVKFLNPIGALSASHSLSLPGGSGDYVTNAFKFYPNEVDPNGEFQITIGTSGNVAAGIKFLPDGTTRAWNDATGAWGTDNTLLTYMNNGSWDTWTIFIINYGDADGTYKLIKHGPSFDSESPVQNLRTTPSGIDTLSFEKSTDWGAGGYAGFDTVYINPEPSTILMMLLSLCGLTFKRFLKKS